MARGKLVVVGTGIRVSHLTPEARTYIETAEVVLHGVYDPATEALIRQLQPSSESLMTSYAEGKLRTTTYAEMIERILAPVREGRRVCVALYGHPGIVVYPSHAAIHRARREGHEAKMLPAISSVDCLFADVGIDPGHGCQMYDATDLLLLQRPVDATAMLIVWMIGAVGDPGFSHAWPNRRNLAVLAEYLAKLYGGDHEVVVYEAAFPVDRRPRIVKTALSGLAEADVTAGSTLYVPPRGRPTFRADVAERLGMSREALGALFDLEQ